MDTLLNIFPGERLHRFTELLAVARSADMSLLLSAIDQRLARNEMENCQKALVRCGKQLQLTRARWLHATMCK